MTHRTFVPEICTNIAQWTARPDLPALALTSRAFLHAVQPILYQTMHLPTTHCAHLACSTLAEAPRLGAYVRTFGLYNSSSRRAQPAMAAFWSLVHAALSCMDHLETIILVDPTGSHGAVLEGVKSEVLKEVRVRLPWDRTFVTFLGRQKLVKHLQCVNTVDQVESLPITPDVLPALQTFEGSVTNAAQLLSVPLTHMQLFIDPEASPHLFEYLTELGVNHGSTLRGFNLLELPDDAVPRTIEQISRSCPNLRYLGGLALPPQNRHRLHKHLNALPLIALELFIAPNRWSPPPHRQSPAQHYSYHSFPPMIQRILVTELKTFCPTLNTVILWIEGRKHSWRLLSESEGSGEMYSEDWEPKDDEVWQVGVDWDGGWNTV